MGRLKKPLLRLGHHTLTPVFDFRGADFVTTQSSEAGAYCAYVTVSLGKMGQKVPYKIENYRSDSRICTAFNAAPFLIWSLTHQKERPLSQVMSLRMRPT